MRRYLIPAAVSLTMLVLPALAQAHARMTPSTTYVGSQLFTLAVPTEKDALTTTSIKLTVPDGFNVDSYEAEPGWKRTVSQSGSGDGAVVHSITWTGGATPTDEDSVFGILGEPQKAQTFTFGVEQTYSDGSVVDWTGSPNSASPAPTVTTVSDFGNASSWPVGSIVALIVGIVALLLAGLATLSGRGGGGGTTDGTSTTSGKRDLA